MTQEEWESLCDGCAKCCLHKLEDEDTGKVFYTDVACKYLDLTTCRCQDYSNRSQLVPDCVSLQPSDVELFHWLPHTCSYRLIAEKRPLPDWHHLITGSKERIHQEKKSIMNRVFSENNIREEDLEEHVIRWVR